MKLTIAIIAAMLVAGASGACFNACGGSTRGTCGANDKCTCYAGYRGSDCSIRQCAFSRAFGGITESSASGRGDHYYAECGGVGECDSNTGLCECNEGYEGKGCKRTSCPGGCSGHGTCERIGTVNSGYEGWDGEKTQVCVCDPGYEGISCKKRSCPVGNDPMTAYNSAGTLEVSEIQQIAIADGAGLTGTFYLSFENYLGEQYDTWVMDTTTVTALSIKEALEGLPNQVIPSVEVNIQGTHSGTARTFRVTFTDKANTGNLANIAGVITGCTLSGCQPRYAGSATTTITTTEIQEGTSENAECANRGACDYDKGLCVCNTGFRGRACESQTVII